MPDLRLMDFSRGLAGYQPIAWEQIPDLGLYMDQVITFLERQCKGLYSDGERIFTPAMVNNYVKLGLVDRPAGKKYGREQLAQLLMICVLKQAASADGMKQLLKTNDLPALYAHFCEMQRQVVEQLANETPMPSPMSCAVHCAAYRFLCNAVLTTQSQPAPEPKENAE